ncbi:DNA-directed RNA polymerase subunit delta [Salsuginibacillus halophilus]|uniref:RNAP delta factor n=1 Tax=Salsuginibacillus halophilus TaxID=517424 RepID=A0A2P8HHW7_9BACI|nr:DNA-directed RNA polymerase subunit delta [Salsuginibacillus halophilus]PSL45824.1 DNA-directed RNA polymerase subunit delta [Salsuginibacillus halophilus]
MGLKTYTNEQIQEFSSLEIAHALMAEKKEPVAYTNLFEEIAEMKGYGGDEKRARRTKLYTTMNIDGRFAYMGDNHWALRGWYPAETSDEELASTFKANKKKSTEAPPEDAMLDEDFEEGFENIEDELDELSQEENAGAEEKDEFAAFDDSQEVTPSTDEEE